MRLLVTGGAGFIGSQLVRTVLTGGYAGYDPTEVVVLDALTYAGSRSNLEPVATDPRLRFVHGDIRDAATVDAAMTGVDQVAHLAAESHVDRSITGATDFVTTNVVGTQVLLDAALRHGVSRFVHVSTDEVYGSIETGSWPESHPLAPNSPYSASKAGSDLLALAYARTHGLPVTVTRCSNNYGPYQFPEKVIPLFVSNLLDGATVPLYGDGGNVRDWLHVADHCRGIQLVLRGGRPGEVYNIGGNCERTNLSLVHTLCEIIDELRPPASGEPSASLIKFVQDRPGHDVRYAIDSSKARRELHWQPRQDLDSGLRATVAWYLDNARWTERVTTGNYRRERLGLNA